MGNMSYCRFHNTCSDLEDCYDHINDKGLSESEKKYRERLIEVCQNIVDEAITPQDIEDEDDDEEDE